MYLYNWILPVFNNQSITGHNWNINVREQTNFILSKNVLKLLPSFGLSKKKLILLMRLGKLYWFFTDYFKQIRIEDIRTEPILIVKMNIGNTMLFCILFNN